MAPSPSPKALAASSTTSQPAGPAEAVASSRGWPCSRQWRAASEPDDDIWYWPLVPNSERSCQEESCRLVRPGRPVESVPASQPRIARDSRTAGESEVSRISPRSIVSSCCQRAMTRVAAELM